MINKGDLGLEEIVRLYEGRTFEECMVCNGVPTPPQLELPFLILKFNTPPPSSEIFYFSLPSIVQFLNFPTPFV